MKRTLVLGEAETLTETHLIIEAFEEETSPYTNHYKVGYILPSDLDLEDEEVFDNWEYDGNPGIDWENPDFILDPKGNSIPVEEVELIW